MKTINSDIREGITVIIPDRGKRKRVEHEIIEYPTSDSSLDFPINSVYTGTITATKDGTEYEIEVFKADGTEVKDIKVKGK